MIRHLRVRCLPQDIPSHFELDVRDLGIGQSKRLSDLEIPNTVRPLMNLKEVAAVIVKRSKERRDCESTLWQIFSFISWAGKSRTSI